MAQTAVATGMTPAILWTAQATDRRRPYDPADFGELSRAGGLWSAKISAGKLVETTPASLDSRGPDR